jgi:predicted metal-dependent hydrolase
MRFALKRGPETLAVEIAGRELPVPVRRSRRARRLILRIDSASGTPALTLPWRASLMEGERFLARHAGWIAARLGDRPAGRPLVHGAIVPVQGDPRRIVHVGGRGIVRPGESGGEPALLIPGDAAHVPRRVADFLKQEARRHVSAAVARHAMAIGRTAPRVRIGDARSRWGSCSARGAVAFSWRLILAPAEVLDYVAAHEAAHLREMNHGPAFWALVEELSPDFRRHRAWLKRNGAELHAYGRAES